MFCVCILINLKYWHNHVSQRQLFFRLRRRWSPRVRRGQELGLQRGWRMESSRTTQVLPSFQTVEGGTIR